MLTRRLYRCEHDLYTVFGSMGSIRICMKLENSLIANRPFIANKGQFIRSVVRGGVAHANVIIRQALRECAHTRRAMKIRQSSVRESFPA